MYRGRGRGGSTAGKYWGGGAPRRVLRGRGAAEGTGGEYCEEVLRRRGATGSAGGEHCGEYCGGALRRWLLYTSDRDDELTRGEWGGGRGVRRTSKKRLEARRIAAD